jgi:hypothetical protein
VPRPQQIAHPLLDLVSRRAERLLNRVCGRDGRE